MKKHVVHLTGPERARLNAIVHAETTSTRVSRRARVLPLSAQGMTDRAIAQATYVSIPTVERTRAKFAAGGLEFAVEYRPRGTEPRKMDLYLAGRLAGLLRSRPPAGHARWTLHLLASELVRRGIVDSISPECVRRAVARFPRPLR